MIVLVIAVLILVGGLLVKARKAHNVAVVDAATGGSDSPTSSDKPSAPAAQ